MLLKVNDSTDFSETGEKGPMLNEFSLTPEQLCEPVLKPDLLP